MNLLVRKFQRKRTIFRKSPSFSLENLRKLSPHQKSFPTEEMENKHHEKKKFKKDIILISNQLKTGLGVLLYNALLHQVNIAVGIRYKVMSIRHQKKIVNLIKIKRTNMKVTSHL